MAHFPVAHHLLIPSRGGEKSAVRHRMFTSAAPASGIAADDFNALDRAMVSALLVVHNDAGAGRQVGQVKPSAAGTDHASTLLDGEHFRNVALDRVDVEDPRFIEGLDGAREGLVRTGIGDLVDNRHFFQAVSRRGSEAANQQ